MLLEERSCVAILMRGAKFEGQKTRSNNHYYIDQYKNKNNHHSNNNNRNV